MITHTYDIKPVTKPRMTQRDKWTKTPRPQVARYFSFKDQCRLFRVHLPPSGAKVTFIVPMPPSWSIKKKVEFNGQPHTSTPDLSNLLKALEDAVYGDDSMIWSYDGLKKLWGPKGLIIIET